MENKTICKKDKTMISLIRGGVISVLILVLYEVSLCVCQCLDSNILSLLKDLSVSYLMGLLIYYLTVYRELRRKRKIYLGNLYDLTKELYHTFEEYEKLQGDLDDFSESDFNSMKSNVLKCVGNIKVYDSLLDDRELEIVMVLYNNINTLQYEYLHSETPRIKTCACETLKHSCESAQFLYEIFCKNIG